MSTVGLLSGVAIAGVPRETVFLTGVVLLFVEAFSMAAGSFLSESSAQEYSTGTDKTTRGSIVSGGVMFFSYFFSGFIPLSAYLLWPTQQAIPYSIGAALVALAGLGTISARISKTSVLHDVIKMVCVGGVAIVIGIVVGGVVSRL